MMKNWEARERAFQRVSQCISNLSCYGPFKLSRRLDFSSLPDIDHACVRDAADQLVGTTAHRGSEDIKHDGEKDDECRRDAFQAAEISGMSFLSSMAENSFL
jgi:hypothetical protein